MEAIQKLLDASFGISKKLALDLSKELLELYNSNLVEKSDESIFTFIPLNIMAYFIASNSIALAKSYNEAGNNQATPKTVLDGILELTHRYMNDETLQETIQ